MKVNVKISYEWWEATVEIFRSDETTNNMKEQLLFWGGGQERIDNQDGNIEQAYLKMLGEYLIAESIIGWTVKGLIDEWNDKEGWSKLDGSAGIKLLSCSNWEFETEEFFIDRM